MSTANPKRPDRRRQRHERSKLEIVEAAWALARRDGLAGLSLRAIARMVEMEPQSLYTYFSSKNDLYDVMFAQANQDLLERQRAVSETTTGSPPRQAFSKGVHTFVEFCAEDAARFSLMFQRTIPGFIPTPASMDVARRVLDDAVAALQQVGVTDAESIDLFLAVVTGLASQQVTNDPGGRRWIDLIDRAIDAFLAQAPTT